MVTTTGISTATATATATARDGETHAKLIGKMSAKWLMGKVWTMHIHIYIFIVLVCVFCFSFLLLHFSQHS